MGTEVPLSIPIQLIYIPQQDVRRSFSFLSFYPLRQYETDLIVNLLFFSSFRFVGELKSKAKAKS